MNPYSPQRRRTEAKETLLATIASSNRGILATETEKATIAHQIQDLEQCNPTPNSGTASQLLIGNWQLLYTTSEELLGVDRLALLQLGQVYQCIRPQTQQVYNLAELNSFAGQGKWGPYFKGLISVAARFEVASAQRLTVQFERFVVGIQGWLGYQTPTQWIERLQAQARFPAIDLSLQPGERQGWIDITYLDQNLRITRGNQNSVFVLTKSKI